MLAIDQPAGLLCGRAGTAPAQQGPNSTREEVEEELLAAKSFTEAECPKTVEILREGCDIFLSGLLKRSPALAQKIVRIETEPGIRAIDSVGNPTLKRLVLKRCEKPFTEELPDTVSKEVYDAAVALALGSIKGVEGSMHGHTLVLGQATALLALGKRNKLDPFQVAEGLDIREKEIREEVRRCMLSDGMSIICGQSGTPIANKFFSDTVSKSKTGGARIRSAWAIAEQAECIVIVISQDSTGEISIVRGYGESRAPEQRWFCLNSDQLVCSHCREVVEQHERQVVKHQEALELRDETIAEKDGLIVNLQAQLMDAIAREQALQDQVDGQRRELEAARQPPQKTRSQDDLQRVPENSEFTEQHSKAPTLTSVASARERGRCLVPWKLCLPAKTKKLTHEDLLQTDTGSTTASSEAPNSIDVSVLWRQRHS